MHIGDVVAIRGDLMLTTINGPYKGRCKYTPDQLIEGKYVKHTGHGGIWLGRVMKFAGDEVLVASGWRGIEFYEVMVKGVNNK